MQNERRNQTLARLRAKDVMRRQVVRLQGNETAEKGIDRMFDYGIDTLLVVDRKELPMGVVTKTDIVAAYHRGLPADTPLRKVMGGRSPVFCDPDEPLETALDRMREYGIHSLFVTGTAPGRVGGVIVFPDVANFLYRHCRDCRRGDTGKERLKGVIRGLKAEEMMTGDTHSFPPETPLSTLMEGMADYRPGAVLLTDHLGIHRGVLSKADLMLAFRHGIPTATPAKIIMSPYVVTCGEHESLENAIRQMIFAQIQRIFIYSDDPETIVGVLSLADAVRLRSGTCKACVSSCVRVERSA